jgi:hypothetical protein
MALLRAVEWVRAEITEGLIGEATSCRKVRGRQLLSALRARWHFSAISAKSLRPLREPIRHQGNANRLWSDLTHDALTPMASVIFVQSRSAVSATAPLLFANAKQRQLAWEMPFLQASSRKSAAFIATRYDTDTTEISVNTKAH